MPGLLLACFCIEKKEGLMKLFYGEKIVQQEKYLANDKNLIYSDGTLLILSEKNRIEIPLEKNFMLVFWGNVYAVIQNNGTYLPVNLKEETKPLIKELFYNLKFNFNEIIGRLLGDFVGCLIRDNGEAVIFSDAFNKIDVFYARKKDGIIASTDLSVLASGINKSYDQAALANVLSIHGMYAPKKHTIYKGIRRLGVGERLVLEKNNIKVEQTPFSPYKINNYGLEKHDEYAVLLEEAVKIRASHGCNWVYLSSGWDSSSLLALLVKNYTASKVRAVIAKFEYANRSRDANIFEVERARKIAEYYGVHLDVIPIDFTTKDSITQWEEIRNFLLCNHLYADSSCNFHILSKFISKNSQPGDAVFCGEISDGAHNFGFAQFATIADHPVLEFREYSDKMASYLFGPTFFKSILKGGYRNDAVYNLLRSRLQDKMFDDATGFSEKDKKLNFLASFFLRKQRIPFYSSRNQSILTNAGSEMYENEMQKVYLNDCVDTLEPDTVYSWILHLYNSFHWQGSTVKSIYETTQNNNLNLNLPFWDNRLQGFLSQMPENWGRGLEMRPTKYPLKRMLENKIDYPKHLQIGPHAYTSDVNPNFSLEAEILYHSALADHFQESLKDYPFENILDSQYFDIDYFRKLTDGYISGVEVSGQDLSNLYNLVWLCWIGWY